MDTRGKDSGPGGTEEVVTAYESYEREKEASFIQQEQHATYRPTASALAPVRIVAVTIDGVGGGHSACLETFQQTTITVQVESLQEDVPFHIGIAIVRNDKENVFGTGTQVAGEPLIGSGHRQVELLFPKLYLLSGNYWLSVYVLDDSGLQVYDMAESVCAFTVHNPGREPGLVYIPHQWIF